MRPTPRHTFVVPVHGDAPWLPTTLESLRDQTAPTTIIVTTAAPTPRLRDICAMYDIPLAVRSGEAGIGVDWNFALSQVDGGWVTIAHQDDIYLPRYVEDALRAAAPDTTVVFSDYRELVDGTPQSLGLALAVKWLMIETALFPARTLVRSRLRKRLMFGFGDPVCCPSAMINRDRVPGFRFDERLDLDLDWDAWIRLGGGRCSLGYVRRTNVLHRLHPDSATSRGIANTRRRQEDAAMFDQLWPRPVARALAALYAACYRFNG